MYGNVNPWRMVTEESISGTGLPGFLMTPILCSKRFAPPAASFHNSCSNKSFTEQKTTIENVKEAMFTEVDSDGNKAPIFVYATDEALNDHPEYLSSALQVCSTDRCGLVIVEHVLTPHRPLSSSIIVFSDRN